MGINELIISLSIALTIPFLCYCAEILYVWWPTVKDTFKEHGPVDATGRLARGIWIGFAANLLDNVYWLVAWTFVLLRHPLGIIMVLSGSLAHLFFKQLGGIFSARQYLLAAKNAPSERTLSSLHKYYWLAGMLTFAILVTLK